MKLNPYLRTQISSEFWKNHLIDSQWESVRAIPCYLVLSNGQYPLDSQELQMLTNLFLKF